MNSSGNKTSSVYKVVLMVAYSGRKHADLYMLKWEVATLEIQDDRKTVYIVKPYRKWIIKLQNIASIERIFTEAGDVLRLRLKGDRFILLYSTPAILIKASEILSKVTGNIISEIDMFTEKRLLESKGGFSKHE